MKKILILPVLALSLGFLTGCEDLKDAIQESLLPDSLRFADDVYASECVANSQNQTSTRTFAEITEDGTKIKVDQVLYSEDSCALEADLIEGEVEDIEYRYVEIQANTSVLLETPSSESQSEQNEYRAYFINQETNQIYFSSVEPLDSPQEAEQAFGQFLIDPENNASLVYTPYNPQ